MAELLEKDPRLARIVDPKTSRSLLDDPHPLEASLDRPAGVTVHVRIENGPEAPIDLEITADQEWLEPRKKQLLLMGGESLEFPIIVHARGTGEFANLCFSWKGASETFCEYVLVWRKSKIDMPRGVKPTPDWLRDDRT